MSWMKQPQGGAAPPPGPERQPYAAPQPQPYGNQQGMYPNYQGGTAAPGGTQQYWQAPPQQQPQYNQQYGQVYQQQDLGTNANQFYQQTNQYNQNYTNQDYSMQQGYQQNYYQNQGVPPNFNQNKSNADGWEDNWDWGWDESAKQAQKAASASALQQQVTPQQQVFNNANAIEESFVSTNTWNWSTDDKNQREQSAPRRDSNQPVAVSAVQPGIDNAASEPTSQTPLPIVPQPPTEEVHTLNDRDAVKNRLPNLALGKRFHLDNLTPQWSIESQMSQESSDGPQTQSEGTYRSDNQSRNSSKNSPGLNTENLNFNYSQATLEDSYPQSTDWSRHSDDPTVGGVQNGSRRESHDELSNSLHEMSLTNHENSCTHEEERQIQESPVLQPPLVSSANLPPPVSSNTMLQQDSSATMPPPPPVTGVHVPSPATLPPPQPAPQNLPPQTSPQNLTPAQSAPPTLPPPPLSSASMPPTNFPQSSTQNPFKIAGPFSHKSTGKGPMCAPVQSFAPQMSNNNLTSPAVVSKVSHRMPVGFEANLETTPDNSERPDQPQVSAFRPMAISQQVPDNLEVAPQNDRNEYLQTAHLSSSDYGENTDFSRNAPPPGLRRMVVGQQEPEYNQNLNISSDEPPPGLARMVPGQQTEAAIGYNQPADTYMDRHIVGQPTDPARPYRQADGQITPDTYSQPSQNRAAERRPIGLDRLVPGEPSNDQFPQYQGSNYAGTNEQRVVMGVDHDYPIPADAGPSDVREQNVDGSDYTEQTTRNPPRNVIGARETSSNVSPDFTASDEQQREVTMEGENLQDLSLVSSADLTFSREQAMDGADVTITDGGADRKTDLSDSLDNPATSSRRQSVNRVNTSGEDSERDRVFKSSPRRDRDKHKSSRDRDRDRDRERDRERDKEGRYSRGDKKFERDPDRRSIRDERRPERDRRDRDRDRERDRERGRDRGDSPDARRTRRSTRSHRYETEDTDYYSDRERDRTRYREGSYTSSKPPRDERARRHEERERSRRHATEERSRRAGEPRGPGDPRRAGEPRERYERRYRDIDPTSKHGNLRREREEDERRRGGESYSSPSRPESREAAATDDDLTDSRRRDRRSRHRTDPYYEGEDAYLAQRQYQYQYYSRLRLSDPAAYLRVYKQLMAGHTPALPLDYRHHAALYGEGYSSLGYEARPEERGSVHSGRSSTAGTRGHDTYYGAYRPDAGSLRDAPSLRTDVSDRDLNTDASLNLHLEESTVRSERMTPFRYSTAHIKGSISSRDVVVVRPSYPVDGLPATVQLLSLRAALAADPLAQDLAAYPGPLVKGVTHKKSVMDYCSRRAREAAGALAGGGAGGGGRDPLGRVLLWDLLALLLRQNGVVVGSDIAELLMKNTREHPYSPPGTPAHSGRESAAGREQAGGEGTNPEPLGGALEGLGAEEDESNSLDRLREHLIYGNRQEAIEWCVSHGQWGHALQLAAADGRRQRAAVAARFVATLPRHDPLHTLYAALANTTPPAATCVSEERWGDWRPHAAMVLANPSARPEQDRHTLALLGDSLAARGLVYCAQLCYVAGGVPLARHPLAPLAPPGPPPATPRLSLLLADPRAASLAQLATNQALFATEIYEYALSLSQDYVLPELLVYKLVLAARLADCGQYERALGYTEAAARALPRAPPRYPRALPAALAALADRLQYHDPLLQEEPLEDGPGSGEPSPRHHQWLDDVRALAHTAMCAPPEDTPVEQPELQLPQQVMQQPQLLQYPQQVQQPQHPQQVQQPQHPQQIQQPQQYQQYWPEQPEHQYQAPPAEYPEYLEYPEPPAYRAEDPPQPEDWPAQPPAAEPYWQPDHQAHYSYSEAESSAGIRLPGAPSPAHTDRPPSADQTEQEPEPGAEGRREGRGEGREGKEGRGEGRKGGSGWLGGLFTKLALRAPNQMILPDDKNPTIVWDADNKRWRNLEGDEDDSARPPPPPPSAAHTMPSVSPLAPGAPPLAAPAGNIFKMQKSRHIKQSYVDVLNPGAAGRSGQPAPLPAPLAAPLPAPLGPAPAYFIPGPAPAQLAPSTQVSIPPSPRPSPSPSPPLRPPSENAIYDPTAANGEEFHSGI